MGETNWYDSLVSGAGDLWDSVTNAASDLYDSAVEGLSYAFSDGKVPEVFADLTGSSETVYRGGLTADMDWNKPQDSWSGVFGGVASNKTNWPKMIEIGAAFVTGVANRDAAREDRAAQTKASSDAAIQRDQLEQSANKRYSESITGMGPTTPVKPKPLTRLDGSRVFQPTGLINTGAK